MQQPMTPESCNEVSQIADLLGKLLEAIKTTSATKDNVSYRDAIEEVGGIIDRYRQQILDALATDSATDSLRAVNGATSINKGLADQGPWISAALEVRKIGMEVSSKALSTATLLRMELGFTF